MDGLYSSRLRLEPPKTGVFRHIISWHTDFVDASGLVYYTYEATTRPVPVPVTVPAPEPSTKRVPVPTQDNRVNRWLDTLWDVLEAIGMALLEILKWLAILAAIIIAIIAAAFVLSAATAEAAVAAVIVGIAFMIDQIRGGSTSGEEGMAALTGREA